MTDELTALLRRELEARKTARSGTRVTGIPVEELGTLAARLAEVVRTAFVHDLREGLEKANRERDAARRSEEHLRKLLLTEEGERRRVERELSNLEHLLDILRAPRKIRHPEGGEVDLNLAGRLDVLVNPRNVGTDDYRTPAELMDALGEAAGLLASIVTYSEADYSLEDLLRKARAYLARRKDRT